MSNITNVKEYEGKEIGSYVSSKNTANRYLKLTGVQAKLALTS